MSEYRKQEAPYTIKLELTEGCNLRCSFCGLQGIRASGQHDYKFLTPEFATQIAANAHSLGWNSRYELAMHGEPSMNPQMVEIVAAIRRVQPKAHIMMTSNGGGLLRKPGPVANIAALFNAGLNVLALDDYKGAGIVPKIRAAIADECVDQGIEDGTHVTDPVVRGWPDNINMFECPEDPKGNPYRRHPVSYKMVSFIKDLEDTKNKGNGIRSHMNNGCGAAFPPVPNTAGRCARPFRELAIRWNGNVSICCNDWRGEYKCGNVITHGLDAVWQSAEMNAARKKLYHRTRDFAPCKGCDNKSFRVGLLPDPMGKHPLPLADDRDEAIIAGALAGGPYTAPVKRPWEV